MADARDARRLNRVWEKSLKGLTSRTRRFEQMLNHYLPLGALEVRWVKTLDEMFAHRNALTREIIQVLADPTSTHVPADAAGITPATVDQYFDTVGDFIIATMVAFAPIAGRETGDAA